MIKDADEDKALKSWLAKPLHPLFISILPLVIILAQNSGEIKPADAIRSGVISLAFVGLIGLSLFMITRNLSQAAIGVTLMVAYFHTAGRLSSGNVMPPLRAILGELGSASLLGLFSILILVLILALPRLRRYFPQVNLALNVIGLSLLVSFASTVALNEWKIFQPDQQTNWELAAAASSDKPDIYYIVLDGYARQDVLVDLYGAEALLLHDYLSSEGFHIVETARSNYMQTSLSIASSLNADYLQALRGQADLDSRDRFWLMNLIRHNQVGAFLSEHGYSVTTVESGYRPTEVIKSSSQFSLAGLETNLLERLVIENSLLRAAKKFPSAPDWLAHPGYQRHRLRVNYALERLKQLSEEPAGGRFIFSHFLVPHPPFVFEDDGTNRQPDYPYVLLDGDAFPGNQLQYRQHYEDQRAYLDSELIKTIDTIIDNHGDQSVIILQSDHGPGSELAWSSADNTNLRERFGILMAYRLPPAASQPAYEPKSPVNLFRMLLGELFDVDLHPLPEQSYYSTWDQPLNFTQVEGSSLEPLDQPEEGSDRD